MTREQLKEMVCKYRISPEKRYCSTEKSNLTGRIVIANTKISEEEKLAIKAAKPEIMEYFTEQEDEERKARQDRQERIDAIPGLKEILNANAEIAKWRTDFNRAMESEDGCIAMRPAPQYDLDDMLKQYPIAAAYLKAEEYSFKSNYELAAIGSRALERIIYSPDDYESIMRDMVGECDAFAQRHMWD